MCISALLFATECAHADHLVGGEINYTCNGNNDYTITMRIYRDCFATGAAFDPNPVMTIFEGNTQIMTLSWNGFEVSTMPIVGTGPCFIDPPNVCVQVGVYERTVNLPPSPQGYTIVHQRCCRGFDILNLTNPDSQGNTYFVEIPPNDTDCNNSPEFSNLPPVAVCVNEELNFDHSATDLDGDELEYSLCTPYHGGSEVNPAPNPAPPPPYTPVSWAPGFGPTNPIPSDPAFDIDPETGLITGSPDQIGQFVVGICVSEFRDGVLLSTTRRDFQINVVPCNPVIEAMPGIIGADDGGCAGFDFQFTNNSINADEFIWDFGDGNGPESTSFEYEPEHTYADTGNYNVMLIANPGEVCADTATIEVSAFPAVSVNIDSSGFNCIDGQNWGFELSGDFDPGNTSISWDFGENALPLTSEDQNPQNISYSEPGNKQVSVTIDQYGCTAEDQVNISVADEISAGIAPQSEFCQGLTLNFTNESTNASMYEWHFNDPAQPDALGTFTNATHTFSSPGQYDIMLVAKNNGACPDTAYSTYEVNSLLEAFIESEAAQCFEGNSFAFQADGVFGDDAAFTWDFGSNATPSSSTLANPPPVSYDSTGIFQITLTIEEGDCIDSYAVYAPVLPAPVADFSAPNREGCAPFTVGFNNESEAETVMSYSWDFGDGQTSNSAQPIHTFEEPGVYTVSLDVNTTSGCVGESFKTRTDYIVVHEVPRAGFSFNPQETTIFEPEVSIVDESEGAFDCQYLFPDSSEVTDCNFTYLFDNAGEYEVTQIVTNEEGCQASLTQTFEVLGHLFYAPNAFSPNGDGVNEIFKPVTLGISAFEMEIISRTGETIYRTTDADEGWNGAGPNGEYYVAPEVFLYKVRISDMRGINYDYQGHVTVVR